MSIFRSRKSTSDCCLWRGCISLCFRVVHKILSRTAKHNVLKVETKSRTESELVFVKQINPHEKYIDKLSEYCMDY
jgi:hypothetical protein